MGCVNAKLVPGEGDDTVGGPGPETVYTGETSKSKDEKLPKDKDFTDIEKVSKAESDNQSQAQSQQQTMDKRKYRVKMDPRVTAKYDIKALIGRGSFSRVVRVEHRQSKQPYAIKMIDRLQGKEVFEAELAVLRRVKHKYVITLVEVFESRDKVYMVMELATGGELFDRIIAKGSFTERDAIRVMRMVMEGLKYLHSLGITHRDLKPENLLYYHPGHESRILITDFGLSAHKRAGEEYMQTTCGTPEYIAPEILARKPYNSLVDEWAAGVICYIMLSGTMPFDDENRTRLYRQILTAKYSYTSENWKDISSLAKDFIDKLLVLETNERMTAAQALTHAWLVSNTAGSSNINLHRTISHNLIHRQQSTRANSTKSNKSNRSNRSNLSNRSLRSEHRRVLPEEIEQLHKDPEFVAEMNSISSQNGDSHSTHSGQS